MDFNEIKKEVKNINFDTLRIDRDNYFEAVIVKAELEKLNERLKKFFGDSAWPSVNRLSSQMQEAVRNFGGIMPGQTLYFWDKGSETIFAMLWPWGDGRHTTVKIVKK